MKAPDFALPDQTGTIHNLKDYAGKWLVLYFYPKDETTGCIAEACNFRDQRDAIAEFGGAEVVGISKDSVESHKAFAEHYNLNFTILSDPAHRVIQAYDSWQEGASDGIGTLRNTFIISPRGDIVKTYKGVDPKVHAGEIINVLKELQEIG
jgi:peroxiredoxin Q/BCP